ncbi:MAG: hypothetical protein ABI682_07020 [Acidobacteriota bacterium]
MRRRTPLLLALALVGVIVITGMVLMQTFHPTLWKSMMGGGAPGRGELLLHFLVPVCVLIAATSAVAFFARRRP